MGTVIFRLLVVLFATVARAHNWPTITVGGDGVLRAGSDFEVQGKTQLNGVSHNVAYVSASTYDTATELTFDSSIYRVATVNEGYAVRLPTPIIGQSLRLITDTTHGIYLRPAAASGLTINSTTVDFYMPKTNSTVDCLATTATNFDCAVFGLLTTSVIPSEVPSEVIPSTTTSGPSFTTISASQTLTTAQSDDIILADMSGAAFTLTFPSCSSGPGTRYTLVVADSTNTLTIQAASTDIIIASVGFAEVASSVGGTITLKVGGGTYTAGASSSSNVYFVVEFRCAGSVWVGNGAGGGGSFGAT